MTVVRFAPEARRDFDDILNYLMQMAGGRVAERYTDRIIAAVDQLAEFPGIGTPRPELGTNTRFLVLHPYLLFYDIGESGNDVQILRLLHGRRNITAQLFKR